MKREVKLEAAAVSLTDRKFERLMSDRPNPLCRKDRRGIWVSLRPGRVVK